MQAGNVISLDKVLGIKRIWTCFHWAHSSKWSNLWKVFEKAEFWEGNICCILQVRVNGSGFFSWFKWFSRMNNSVLIWKTTPKYSHLQKREILKELNSTSGLYRKKIRSNCAHLFTRNSVSVSCNCGLWSSQIEIVTLAI